MLSELLVLDKCLPSFLWSKCVICWERENGYGNHHQKDFSHTFLHSFIQKKKTNSGWPQLKQHVFRHVPHSQIKTRNANTLCFKAPLLVYWYIFSKHHQGKNITFSIFYNWRTDFSMKPYEVRTTLPTSKYGLQLQSPHYEGDGIRYETETRSIKSFFSLSSR